MSTKSFTPTGVTITDRDLGTVVINRSKIISLEKVKVGAASKEENNRVDQQRRDGDMSGVLTMTRIRCYNGITYIVDMLPTEENMRSLMPI